MSHLETAARFENTRPPVASHLPAPTPMSGINGAQKRVRQHLKPIAN